VVRGLWIILADSGGGGSGGGSGGGGEGGVILERWRVEVLCLGAAQVLFTPETFNPEPYTLTPKP